MMKKKEHLTKEGLEKIKKIKAEMNTGRKLVNSQLDPKVKVARQVRHSVNGAKQIIIKRTYLSMCCSSKLKLTEGNERFYSSNKSDLKDNSFNQ